MINIKFCYLFIHSNWKKKELIQHAKKHGADEDIMEVLEGLPDKEYKSPIEVSEEFPGEQSRRRNESSRERESSRNSVESA